MIITILVLILIIIIILVLRNREKFKNLISYKDKYKYLNIDEASKVLESVEELKNYNELDYKLRNIDTSKYSETHEFYIERLEKFSKQDKTVLDWVMKTLHKKTPDNLKFLYDDITFAKYSSGVENDYPHTHKNTIFLSSKFLSSCIFYFNTNMEEDMLENFGVVIIHECVHLWQRKEPGLFNKLYIYYWNFIKVDKIQDNHLLDKVRFNPDGIEQNWVLSNKNNTKHVVLISLYKNNSRNIANVENVAIELNKHGMTFIMPSEKNIKMEPIIENDVFNELFENVNSNNYHPNELSAELISIYYLQQMDISHYDFDNKALRKLESWFKKEIY